VLAFDDQIDTPPTMPAGLVAGSDRNRFAAASWLGSLQSRGGTAMAEPLRKAVEILAASARPSLERQASVVLVTDGQITGEDHLLRLLAPAVGRTRIYCVGIDRAVNAGFLERLAQLGNGRAELVESEERLDESMTRLARTIGRPALTAIRVRAEGVETIDETLTPSRLPDAFAGVPCVISGRYRCDGRPTAESVTLRIDADAAAGPFTAALPARLAPDALAVQTIWARSVVRDLEDEYASWRGDEELAARLVAHSIRFGVLSRFTAFVAIDPEKTEAGPLTEVVQPVEQPSGWAAAPAGFMPAPAPLAAGGFAAKRMVSLPAAVPAEQAPPQRSLKDLLKLVEKGVRGDDSGLDDVWAELTAHRDTASDAALSSALTVLCDALNRYLCTVTEENARKVIEAVDAVRRVLPKRRFWT
jgi:hypothetical protein